VKDRRWEGVGSTFKERNRSCFKWGVTGVQRANNSVGSSLTFDAQGLEAMHGEADTRIIERS
jgi:hypothetical protein